MAQKKQQRDLRRLANSASYEIYMKDVSMQDALVTYLESLDGVREVHHSAVVANTLSDFNKLIAYVSGGIILILLAVAIFLISNTVTVGISVRREEIAIMKLIGATDSFVRAPFVVMNFIPVAELFHSLVPISLLLGVGIGFVGSRLTIKKHLKV